MPWPLLRPAEKWRWQMLLRPKLAIAKIKSELSSIALQSEHSYYLAGFLEPAFLVLFLWCIGFEARDANLTGLKTQPNKDSVSNIVAELLFMNKDSATMRKNVDSPLMKLLTAKKKTPAEMADVLGVHERSVFYWLSGEREPRFTVAQVQALCSFLGCTVYELPVDFSRESSAEPDS